MFMPVSPQGKSFLKGRTTNFLQCLCKNTGFITRIATRSSLSISLSHTDLPECSVTLITISGFGEDEEKPGNGLFKQ